MNEAKNQVRHLVIVGGVAGGAAAAARARRLSETTQITVVERGEDVSFSACGMPYHISGEIAARAALSVQTATSLEKTLAISVRTKTEAVKIDRERRVLLVRNSENFSTEEIPYDKLILATGARPVRPPFAGANLKNVFTLRTLGDMDAISAAAKNAREAVVIGAGFIGVETAEALKKRGLSVTLIETAPHVLPPLDPGIAIAAEDAMTRAGIRVLVGRGVAKIEKTSEENLAVILADETRIDANFVVLAAGVVSENSLAVAAGLRTGTRGAIVVDEFQRTSDPDIYAVGDAVETADRVSGARTILAMGGPANRQGRTAANHIFLGEKGMPYAGSTGTAIVRAFDVACGITGMSERRARAAGIDCDAVVVSDFSHASYFPDAEMLTLKLVWEKNSGRVLGAQAFGKDGVDKRLDVLATAIAARMTIRDLVHVELSYAPPFGSAKDVVNIAAFQATNIADGLFEATSVLPDSLDTTAAILDVRPTAAASAKPVPNAINIPLASLRARLGELERNKIYTVICFSGKTSYFATRILTQNGFRAKSLSGGVRIHRAGK